MSKPRWKTRISKRTKCAHRVVVKYTGIDSGLERNMEKEACASFDEAGFIAKNNKRDLEWWCVDLDAANRIADRLRKFEPRIRIEVS